VSSGASCHPGLWRGSASGRTESRRHLAAGVIKRTDFRCIASVSRDISSTWARVCHSRHSLFSWQQSEAFGPLPTGADDCSPRLPSARMACQETLPHTSAQMRPDRASEHRAQKKWKMPPVERRIFHFLKACCHTDGFSILTHSGQPEWSLKNCRVHRPQPTTGNRQAQLTVTLPLLCLLSLLLGCLLGRLLLCCFLLCCFLLRSFLCHYKSPPFGCSNFTLSVLCSCNSNVALSSINFTQ
jgi:hypothetical protein